MAINKKLILFQKLSDFNTQLSAGNILDTSIVFIKDVKQIYTQGQMFPCSYTQDELAALFAKKADLTKLDDYLTKTAAASTYQPKGNYLTSLPTANGDTAGIVKGGGDVTITSGVITVNDNSHNHVISNVDGLQSALDSKVPTSRTINGKDLSSNISLTAANVGADASGSASQALATAKSYTDSEITKLANTKGTYSKPSGGIPKTDLATSIQESLEKADTALQTELDPIFKASAAYDITSSDITNWNSKTSNIGTVTGIKINGSTKNPSSGIVDLGTIITSIPVTSVAGKTGAVTLAKGDVGLGNVTNESKATMFTNAALTGTPTAPTAGSTTNTTQIATTAFVQSAIDAKLAANDAMIFKGTIGATSGKDYTVTSLPSTHNAGWTYKVAEAGTYAGVKCEIGDMIICITDSTSSNDAHWTVVQNNTDGAVTGPASAADNAVAIFNGTTGKIIKNSGLTIATSVPKNAVFTDTHHTTGIVAGASGATANASATNPYVAVTDNSTYRSQIQLKGSGATTVSSDANGVITISSTDNNTWRSISDSVSSTSSDVSASSKAVKTVYDLAASKTSNTGTVTKVSTGKGLTGGDITTTGTIKCNLNSETSLGTIGSTSKLYAVGVDANNKLCVNVPWTDNNTTYLEATTSAAGLMSASDKSKLNGIQSGADAVSFSQSLTSGTKIGTITINGSGTDLYCQTNTNTTYSAGNGLTLSSTTFNVGAGIGIVVADDTVGAKLRSTTALTIDSAAATTTSGRVYPVAVDKSGYLSVNVPWSNTTYSSKTAASGGTDVSLVTTGEKYAWNAKQNAISDLSTIRSGASKGATAVQPSSLAAVATSGSYNDLSNKPSIPSAVTESTVSGWGFTKNTGTYSKPSTGIPKTDLASAVQTSLGKADTALQSYTEKYTGTITGIKMNGSSKGTSGVVDLGTVITAHQDISGKLDATVAASTYLTKTDAANSYLGKTAKAASATTADSATTATNLSTKPSLAKSGNNITVTAGGKTSDAFTVPYATSAGSATTAGTCTGNAATATKATQDASGNTITSTYATKSSINGKQDRITVVDHGTSDTSFALTSNVFHKWGTVTSLTLTLATPSDTSVYNEYMFEFVSGTKATSLSLPSTVKWMSTPTITTGKTYQCSIVNNIGVFAAV